MIEKLLGLGVAYAENAAANDPDIRRFLVYDDPAAKEKGQTG